MLTIVAKIPEDNDRIVHYGGTGRLLVQPTSCEWCEDRETAAAMLVKDEQGLDGCVPCFICRDCYNKHNAQITEHEKATDVADRPPKPGCIFMVHEGTKDGRGCTWLRFFTSFREACGFYRKLESAAKRYGGLCPDDGIQEVSEEELDHCKTQKENEPPEGTEDALNPDISPLPTWLEPEWYQEPEDC